MDNYEYLIALKELINDEINVKSQLGIHNLEKKLFNKHYSQCRINYIKNYRLSRIRYKVYNKYKFKLFDVISDIIENNLKEQIPNMFTNFIDISEVNYGT